MVRTFVRCCADSAAPIKFMPARIPIIKQGAKLIDGIQDILDELGHLAPASTSVMPDISVHHSLLDQMGFDPAAIDILAVHADLTGETLSAMLLMLELEGKVAGMPSGRYQRITS